MSFDIRTFKSRHMSPLRNNKFEFKLNRLPNALGNFGPMFRDLVYYAEAVDFPGMKIMNDDIRRYGYGVTEKKPYAAFFDDCRVIFRDDQNGNVQRFMRAWQNSVFKYEFNSMGVPSVSSPFSPAGGLGGGVSASNSPGLSTYEVGMRDDYAVDCTISIYDDSGSNVLNLVMRECFPSLMADNPLAWSATNQYFQIPVSFAYTDFRFEQPPARAPVPTPRPDIQPNNNIPIPTPRPNTQA